MEENIQQIKIKIKKLLKSGIGITAEKLLQSDLFSNEYFITLGYLTALKDLKELIDNDIIIW